MMGKSRTRGRDLVVKGERFFGHVAAALLGLALMVAGLGMGVTMVLLPVGIVVGVVGVLVFVWGLFGHLETRRSKSTD